LQVQEENSAKMGREKKRNRRKGGEEIGRSARTKLPLREVN
jgi:hypothetical protein